MARRSAAGRAETAGFAPSRVQAGRFDDFGLLYGGNDHLGDAYWQSGRMNEARYQWRRALQFGPQENEIKPIEEKLESGLKPPTPAAPRGG